MAMTYIRSKQGKRITFEENERESNIYTVSPVTLPSSERRLVSLCACAQINFAKITTVPYGYILYFHVYSKSGERVQRGLWMVSIILVLVLRDYLLTQYLHQGTVKRTG
jgi:hypothetical protein